jgi:hypothetical protein
VALYVVLEMCKDIARTGRVRGVFIRKNAGFMTCQWRNVSGRVISNELMQYYGKDMTTAGYILLAGMSSQGRCSEIRCPLALSLITPNM